MMTLPPKWAHLSSRYQTFRECAQESWRMEIIGRFWACPDDNSSGSGRHSTYFFTIG
jgi:hypothetical protein